MSLNNATYGTRRPTSPSELDQRITLQYAVKTANGKGGFTTTWATHATVWAKHWTVSSNEGDAGLNRIDKFKIRNRKLMRVDWRILWKGRYFDIASIDPDDRNEFIFLIAKEVTA
jgi:SPP1 family predicted phage head-tail adaptor